MGLDNKLSFLRVTKQHWVRHRERGTVFVFGFLLLGLQDFSEPLICDVLCDSPSQSCVVLCSLSCSVPPKSLACIITFCDVY